jgi:hypothetical protein
MKALVALAVGLALVSPALAQDRVQDVLEALRAEHGFPGATVAWVAEKGEVQTRAAETAARSTYWSEARR